MAAQPFTLFNAPAPELSTLERLYARAFPQESLWPLVRELLDAPQTCLSIFADENGQLIGHAAFTDCGLDGRPERLGLLGPIAVEPDRQRAGVGAALIEHGLTTLRERSVAQVQVLGDPAYYARFGFEPDPDVMAPYPLPDDWAGAWRRLSLTEALEPLTGALIVPAPWRRPELWRP